MGEHTGEIFMSYSRRDREFVDALTRDLEQRGFPVWMDRQDIGGGTAWREAISRAIRECRAFLAILSPNSVDSKNVEKELSLADQHDRPIIPILYQKCEIPPDMDYQLAGLQRVDFVELSYEEALDKLTQALGKKAEAGKPRQDRSARGDQPTSPSPQSPTSTGPAPFAPPAAPVMPPAGQVPVSAVPPSVAQILPGVWQVQIGHPYAGLMGQVTLELAPNGLFRGQLMGPAGMSAVQGQWQVNAPNQLVLQGQQTNGFQVVPYAAVIQFHQITPTHLMGVTGMGEQVIWQRIQ